MDKKISNRKITALHYILVLIIYTFVSFSEAYAQFREVEVGDRVRVTAPSVKSKKIKGIVSEFSSENLTVSNSDTTIFIPKAAISRMEMSTGKKRNTGKGAMIGAVSGAVFLGVLSVVTNEPCKQGEWCFIELSPAEAFGFGALVGALGGGLNGAIIGTLIKTDRWKEVPVQISASAIQTPKGGLSIGPKLVVRF